MAVNVIMLNIVKKSLSEQIYDILKQEILGQKISFGQRLVNRDLQERFGVSSTPIRDAINRLYLDGLVDEITKVGAKIIEFDLNFALEMNEFIAILCTAAIKLSAQKSSKEDVVASLEAALHTQRNPQNEEEYFQSDFIFHRTFFDYCENNKLKQEYEQYNVLRSMLVFKYYSTGNSKSEAIAQHEKILDAYRQGNIEEAVQSMDIHYAYAAQLLKDSFNQ